MFLIKIIWISPAANTKIYYILTTVPVFSGNMALWHIKVVLWVGVRQALIKSVDIEGWKYLLYLLRIKLFIIFQLFLSISIKKLFLFYYTLYCNTPNGYY